MNDYLHRHGDPLADMIASDQEIAAAMDAWTAEWLAAENRAILARMDAMLTPEPLLWEGDQA